VTEATTILTVKNTEKVQYHSSKTSARKGTISKVPFAARASEGFGTFFGIGDFQGHFWGGTGLVV
jgi:hypothetical protein